MASKKQLSERLDKILKEQKILEGELKKKEEEDTNRRLMLIGKAYIDHIESRTVKKIKGEDGNIKQVRYRVEDKNKTIMTIVENLKKQDKEFIKKQIEDDEFNFT